MTIDFPSHPIPYLAEISGRLQEQYWPKKFESHKIDDRKLASPEVTIVLLYIAKRHI